MLQSETARVEASQQTALHVSMSCRWRLEAPTDAIIYTYQATAGVGADPSVFKPLRV